MGMGSKICINLEYFQKTYIAAYDDITHLAEGDHNTNISISPSLLLLSFIQPTIAQVPTPIIKGLYQILSV